MYSIDERLLLLLKMQLRNATELNLWRVHTAICQKQAFQLALHSFSGHLRCPQILLCPWNSESEENLSYQFQYYLCEAARGGTLGGLSKGRVGIPSTCGGPGLRLLVTSGTSLSYSKKDEKERWKLHQATSIAGHRYPKSPSTLLRLWLKVIHKLRRTQQDLGSFPLPPGAVRK